MTTHEIERRLRFAAPDEPAVLPPLVLPLGGEPLAASDRSVALRMGSQSATVNLRLAAAVLLLLGALVGTIATGALRLEQLYGTLTPDGQFSGRGMELRYPTDWSRLTPSDPMGNSGSAVVLLASSREVDGCGPDDVDGKRPPEPQPTVIDGEHVVEMPEADGSIFSLEDRMYDCLITKPMAAGEIRLVVSQGVPVPLGVAGGIGDFANPEFASWIEAAPGGLQLPSAELGFTERIDSMPARLVVSPTSAIPGAEEVRTWIVATPDHALFTYVQAVLRGPDLDAMREQADGIARSLDFEHDRPELDPGTRDASLAAAVDELDRQLRQYPGTRFLGCLPRTPGEARATLTEGPDGLLAAPLDVVCSTEVAPTELRLWRAELRIAWAAGDHGPAGAWGQTLLFDETGELQAGSTLTGPDGAPATMPGQAWPLPEPVPDEGRFAAGDLVRVLAPGTDGAYLNLDTAQLPPGGPMHAPQGTYLVIVSGPEVYGGRDFYLADTGEEIGWVAAIANGRPLVEAAEAPCATPVTDPVELAYLSPVVRRLCAGGGELAFGPVQAGPLAVEGEQPDEPAWLAPIPRWGLFGAGGRDGVDRGLPYAAPPELGALPTDGWLRVTGHFDDPAAASCRMVDPRSIDAESLPAEVATRRCAERFVVTGFERVGAP